jgi:pimeloyl-ACP methyl ester carboxylesterase
VTGRRAAALLLGRSLGLVVGRHPALVPLLLLALASLQCGGGQAARPAAPTDPPVPQTLDCVSTSAAIQTEVVQFHSPKDGLVRGVVVGRGQVGVVLAHQAGGSLCQWLRYANRLRDEGREVLAFTFVGADKPGEVNAAAAELARRGLARTLLIGASMGGTAALVAASGAGPGVVGVASLSGPAFYEDMNADSAVRKLSIPALFMVAEDDSQFVVSARNLYAACASAQKQLEVRPGSDHGVDLVGTGGPNDQLLEQWIAKVAGS